MSKICWRDFVCTPGSKLISSFSTCAKSDVANDADFVETTRAGIVRLPEEKLPVNPFSRVNAGSEIDLKVATQKFADLIRDVGRRLGTVPAQLLYDAILRGFEAMRGENPPFPDFEIVQQEIKYGYAANNRKHDTLTETMRQLTDFQVFARRDRPGSRRNLTDKTVNVNLHRLTA